MGVSRSTSVVKHSPCPSTAALTQFDPQPRLGAKGAVQSAENDQPFVKRRTEPAGGAPIEVSFGLFRLLPARFLLLEDGEPVPVGSRALAILVVLLERPGELVSKQVLMARVWPDVFVEPGNLTVHISALRRVLRDGRDGNRFIINIPGRGYRFVDDVTTRTSGPMKLVSKAYVTPSSPCRSWQPTAAQEARLPCRRRRDGPPFPSS